ncbi:ImcF-related family protein, partial [Pseudomonas syringae pv. tagetis]|uniref:hypothetical protein n=1 Tax=Pseudomonas syringae group genomosp. 7 TaxID=251699 RepID=UPI0037702F33
ERLLVRMLLLSRRQFKAICMYDLVQMPCRQLLYGSDAVPAIFTRQGWEEFVIPELINLVSGNLRDESDWVLDGEGGDCVV